MTTTPAQILAVGRNYAAHAAELGNRPTSAAPLLFWKPVACLARDGVCRVPRWPEGETRIDYEGEVALVLGRALGPGSDPLPADPWDVVQGVLAALDLSDRTLQKQEPQWVRAKGFADACALGDVAPRPDDPTDVRVRTWLNGSLVQEGHTAQLLFPFRPLLRYLHGFLRLLPGDVILTGTPAGVGPVSPGDRVRIELAAGQGDGARALSSLEVAIEEGPQVASFASLANERPDE